MFNLESAANLRIQEATKYVANAHSKQFRDTGVPYIVHPLEVLKKICLWGVDKVKFLDLWITVLTHDTIEDTEVTYEELKEFFGEKVANWVQMLSFRAKLTGEDSKDYQLAKSRHLDDFVNKPVEVLVAKLADRFCNIIDFMQSGSDYASKYYKRAIGLVEVAIIRRLEIETTFGTSVYDAIDRDFTYLDKTLKVNVYT